MRISTCSRCSYGGEEEDCDDDDDYDDNYDVDDDAGLCLVRTCGRYSVCAGNMDDDDDNVCMQMRTCGFL